MKSLLSLLVVAAASTACTAKFRAPPCPVHQWVLPPEAVGSYRITMLSLGVESATSNRQTVDARLEIEASPHSYQITSDTSLYEFGKAQGTGGGGAKTLTLATLHDFSAACRFGNHYYLQTQERDGTYSLFSLEASRAGLSMTPIGFDYNRLGTQGYTTYIVPKLDNNADGVSYASKFDIDGQYIVDNAELGARGNEALLALSHTGSFGMFFERILEHELAPRAGKPRLKMRVPRGDD